MIRITKTLAITLGCLFLACSTFLTVSALEGSESQPPQQTPLAASVSETTVPETASEETYYTIPGTTAATEPQYTIVGTSEATEPQYTVVGTTAATEPEETQAPAAPAAPAENPPAVIAVGATEGTMPHYYQTDYPDVRYGAGSVKTQGCGITSLAMVATYLTGHDYYPDELAGYFGKYPGTNLEIMEHAAKKLQLPYYKAMDWRECLAALERGCIVIAMMNNKSVFTNQDHLLVLAGMTEDGKIVVHDPLKTNYEKSVLKEGFHSGFPTGWICTGYAGAWVFDPADIPAEPFIYTGERRKIEDMPLYYQEDYPDVRYGEGTISSSGCGIVSLAMVASYMTGHEYLPDELADWFGGYTGSNIDRMLNAADKLKLPWYQARNWHVAKDALKDGNIVVVLVDGRSAFTNSQHFLVVKGLAEINQRVMVNDSCKTNYDKWNLKDGFQNGFTDRQITAGFCGAWVFNVEAMPDDPFIYEEPPTPYVEPRYGDFHLTAAEMDLLARMVWVESRGEPFEGQQAVAEVVLNRIAAGNFQESVFDVVYAANQFKSAAFLEDAKPTQTQYEAIEQALYGPYVLPMDVVFFAQYPVNDNIWGTIGGHVFCHQWDGATG